MLTSSLKHFLAFAAAAAPFCVLGQGNSPTGAGYEVWASDQSNSVPNQASLGVKGSYLWIWDSGDIETQVGGGPAAVPLPCSSADTAGPCDVFTIFSPTLQEYNANGFTGNTLNDLPLFGQLHGVLKDPQNRYVTANMFALGGGYVGVMDTQTKQAVGLFRVTQFGYGASSSGRSVHMSFWNSDGSAILVANLHGKAIERINVHRDATGTITNLLFDTDASLGLGQNMKVAAPATYFVGSSADGAPLMGQVVGMYQSADLGDLTPNNVCKENGCAGIAAAQGGRANNLPICPIPGQNNLVYITLAGGGLLVANTASTPMTIVGEYGQQVVYGAGCGGVEVGSTMFVNSGISASGAGATQSMFALWAFDNNAYLGGSAAENTPLPHLVFEDSGNTATGGNAQGPPSIMDGQIPGQTVRRDSHGAAATVDGKYIHVVDRIQNVVEVFNTGSFQRWNYDLTTNWNGSSGACAAYSVADDSNLPTNDPAPDLMEMTPDGKYLMIALRGPAPVSVSHSAQGSCPGVGVVELGRSGKFGELVTVLRATNTVPDNVNPSVPGGAAYSGTERSDVHGTIVVDKSYW